METSTATANRSMNFFSENDIKNLLQPIDDSREEIIETSIVPADNEMNLETMIVDNAPTEDADIVINRLSAQVQTTKLQIKVLEKEFEVYKNSISAEVDVMRKELVAAECTKRSFQNIVHLQATTIQSYMDKLYDKNLAKLGVENAVKNIHKSVTAVFDHVKLLKYDFQLNSENLTYIWHRNVLRIKKHDYPKDFARMIRLFQREGFIVMSPFALDVELYKRKWVRSFVPHAGLFPRQNCRRK